MNEIAQIRTGNESTAKDEAETIPHNIEAEQQLLGAILTNNELYDRVASIIDASHFYEPVHARIWEVAAARISRNALASPVTLKAFLEDDDGLKELGGAAYLVSKAITAARVVAFPELGMEAVYEFEVKDMPVTVAVDVNGESVHQTGPAIWKAKIEEQALELI